MIAELLNTHFAEVAEKEINNNPLFRSTNTPNYSTQQEKTVLNSFGCHEITMYDLHKAINKLANKNSAGIDGVRASEIKQYWKELGVPLLLIFNFSLKKGIFPKCLKYSTIVPIPKVKNASQPEDFRPISILSVLSKLFEIIIQKRIIQFLLNQNYFSNNQFGFLPQRNTSQAVQEHILEIVNGLKDKKKVMGLYLDISKAFDTVNHRILLDKLFKAGFRGTFHDWLGSYLSEREQRVQCGQNLSQNQPVVTGVPQGSTLGPVLFLIYVNSLLLLPLHGPVYSFADDTAVVYSGETNNEVKTKCEKDLALLNQWFRFHRICPNMKKTKILKFQYKKDTRKMGPPDIFWHLPDCRTSNCTCEKIEMVDKIKYLGMVLNSNLNWSDHSRYLQGKLRKLNYLLYYLKNVIPEKIRIMAYKAFYEPVMLYGIECWGGAADYILQPVRVLQKYAVRAVAGAGRSDHSNPIFAKLRLLPMDDHYRRALAMLLHWRTMMNKLPLPPESSRTRFTAKFKPPRKWLSKKARRQVNYQAPTFGNSLPVHLQTSLGRPCFKKRLKQHLLDTLTSGEAGVPQEHTEHTENRAGGEDGVRCD